jgi:hypothetical protein
MVNCRSPLYLALDQNIGLLHVLAKHEAIHQAFVMTSPTGNTHQGFRFRFELLLRPSIQDDHGVTSGIHVSLSMMAHPKTRLS